MALLKSQGRRTQGIHKQLSTRRLKNVRSMPSSCSLHADLIRVCALPNSRPFQTEAFHNPPVRCASLSCVFDHSSRLLRSISSASGAWPARPQTREGQGYMQFGNAQQQQPPQHAFPQQVYPQAYPQSQPQPSFAPFTGQPQGQATNQQPFYGVSTSAGGYHPQPPQPPQPPHAAQPPHAVQPPHAPQPPQGQRPTYPPGAPLPPAAAPLPPTPQANPYARTRHGVPQGYSQPGLGYR